MRESAPTRKAIEAVWRIEAARLIGGLVRFVRDVDRAEDLAQEALLAALERWPETGIPSRGQCSSAARNASESASSAMSKSPSRRISVAKMRRDSAR